MIDKRNAVVDKRNAVVDKRNAVIDKRNAVVEPVETTKKNAPTKKIGAFFFKSRPQVRRSDFLCCYSSTTSSAA